MVDRQYQIAASCITSPDLDIISKFIQGYVCTAKQESHGSCDAFLVFQD